MRGRHLACPSPSSPLPVDFEHSRINDRESLYPAVKGRHQRMHGTRSAVLSAAVVQSPIFRPTFQTAHRFSVRMPGKGQIRHTLRISLGPAVRASFAQHGLRPPPHRTTRGRRTGTPLVVANATHRPKMGHLPPPTAQVPPFLYEMPVSPSPH